MKKKGKTKEERLKGLLDFLERKAKYMRLSGATKWEKLLKSHLSDLHYKFKCQFPIICRDKYGYILDFLLTDYNIFIEVNSKQFHGSKEQIKKDRQRSYRIQKEGYYPLILWNSQISTYSKDQIDTIIKLKIDMIALKNQEK